MINKLYISTVEHNWGKDDSTLLDHHNIDTIINQSVEVDCHTSIEDIFYENIHKACDNAQEIILVELDENVQTTNFNNSSYGRLFNELIRNKHKVRNFEFNKNFNQLQRNRQIDTAVLWSVGCSVTAGVGLKLDQERWGALLRNKLDMHEINLALGGSSICWSADQILRADIRPGDIVVWGLTNGLRVKVSKNWEFNSVTIKGYTSLNKEYQYWNLDYFGSQTETLNSIHNILHVNNFCEKIGAKLYLANMLDITWIGVVFQNFKNFIDLTYDLQIDKNHIQFIDVGSDNIHPGPLQHQQYSEKLYNFIKENNHGQTI